MTNAGSGFSTGYVRYALGLIFLVAVFFPAAALFALAARTVARDLDRAKRA